MVFQVAQLDLDTMRLTITRNDNGVVIANISLDRLNY